MTKNMDKQATLLSIIKSKESLLLVLKMGVQHIIDNIYNFMQWRSSLMFPSKRAAYWVCEVCHDLNLDAKKGRTNKATDRMAPYGS